MSSNTHLTNFEKKMKISIDTLQKELSSIRTGRAHISMLDTVRVEVYGQQMPINQIGTVSTPDSQTLSVQVWDNNNVKFVEKSIRESNLNLNPVVDGQILRIPIPKLSEERRKEFVKIVSQIAEKIKVSIRNIRREGMDLLKKESKEKKISEDENKKLSAELQKITDSYTSQVDQKIKEKEQEILKI